MKSALVSVLLAISITTMATLAAVGAYMIYDSSRERSLFMPAPKPVPKKKPVKSKVPVLKPLDPELNMPLAR